MFVIHHSIESQATSSIVRDYKKKTKSFTSINYPHGDAELIQKSENIYFQELLNILTKVESRFLLYVIV